MFQRREEHILKGATIKGKKYLSPIVTLLHIYVFIGLLKHNMNTCMKVPMFIYSIV